MVLYMFVFFLVYALAFAVPDLIEGYQKLPPSSGPLTSEELDQAEEISRRAVRGKLHLAFAAALLTTAAGAWFRALPGLRG